MNEYKVKLTSSINNGIIYISARTVNMEHGKLIFYGQGRHVKCIVNRGEWVYWQDITHDDDNEDIPEPRVIPGL